MSFLHIPHVAVRGIAACVPKIIEENTTLAVFDTPEQCQSFISTTGVRRRRLVNAKTCTSDLCFEAACELLTKLDWGTNIDCLIFVTQTPDYYLPATSCILQDRLGLPTGCFTLDISSGCSGWVYGMSVIAALLRGGMMKRGLLLCGDTCTKTASSADKSVWPLFGDAGTATAIEYNAEDETGMSFHFATNGAGAETIIIPDGGYRHPVNLQSFEIKEYEKGISRSNLHTYLNGMDVFSFGISKAPESVRQLLDYKQISSDEIDYYLFHQANLFMNEKIRKKLKIEIGKVPYCLQDFGNTSSASIPLTMVTQLQGKLHNEYLKHIGCGFGVGLSWGSIYFETDHIACPDLIEI